MEIQEDLNNKRFFKNVKRVITKEYIFEEQLKKYNDNPIVVETVTYNQKGEISSKSQKCFEKYHEVMGYDLYDSNAEYFYNDIDLLKKIISYDENFKIDCITEYFYNDENTLNLVKVDRIAFYQTTEFKYFDKQVIKTLINSVVGEVKKDVILYDSLNRIISEESIFRKIEGNYPVKNPSKKYYYNTDSIVTEYFLDSKITSKETKSLSGKLIKRINFNEDESIFSEIEFQYKDNLVTTINKDPEGKQSSKTVAYLDYNYNCIKKLRFNNNDVLENTTEAIFKYDKFSNCIYEEFINCIKYITEYEYQ
ncbi:MAG TPA: hypothetical protein VIV55_02025 [Flavobacterium sp.]